jgi:hypothetical protein
MAKRVSKTLHLSVCQDQSRPPLRNSIDYEMTPEELSKHGATLVDKVVERIHVAGMTVWAPAAALTGSSTPCGKKSNRIPASRFYSYHPANRLPLRTAGAKNLTKKRPHKVASGTGEIKKPEASQPASGF